jgi:hypothetical protein
VAWITERRDLVSGVFSILATLAYLKAFDRGTMGRLQVGWYCTSVGLFAMGLLSKPIVVGLPLVFLALDVYPLRRKQRLRRRHERLVQAAPVIVIMLLIGAAGDMVSSYLHR